MYANVQGTDTGNARDLFSVQSEHAEVEDDPKKLRKITKEIIRILRAEINPLDRKPA